MFRNGCHLYSAYTINFDITDFKFNQTNIIIQYIKIHETHRIVRISYAA